MNNTGLINDNKFWKYICKRLADNPKYFYELRLNFKKWEHQESKNRYDGDDCHGHAHLMIKPSILSLKKDKVDLKIYEYAILDETEDNNYHGQDRKELFNQLNFGLLMENRKKVQKLDSIEQKMDNEKKKNSIIEQKINSIVQNMNYISKQNLDSIEEKMDNVKKKNSIIEKKMNSIEQNMIFINKQNSIEEKMDNEKKMNSIIEKKMYSIEQNMNSINKQNLDSIEKKIQNSIEKIIIYLFLFLFALFCFFSFLFYPVPSIVDPIG